MLLDFITLSLVIILAIIILRTAKLFALSYEEYAKLPFYISLFLGIWLIYLSTLSYLEILYDFSLPPKMPLYVIIPLFLLILIILNRRITNDFVRSISMSWLIYLQGFRIIVELIIWGAFLREIIPVETTFEGQNFDVLVGITAIPVAFLAKNGKVGKNWLIAWNIAGLLILGNTVRVFIAAGYFPEQLGLQSSALGLEFFKLPFLVIAGFLMPFAVLLHALSIKQLLRA